MSLPATAQEIADVIGREQTLYLIGQLPRAYKAAGEYRNGSKVVMYVPKVLHPTDKLVRILGWQDAMKLVREFSGMLIEPANCAHIYRPFRDVHIRRLVDDGVPRVMVAEWFGITERMVRTILSEIPPQDRRAANDNNQPIKHDRRKAQCKTKP
jgi:hypothetical protein